MQEASLGGRKERSRNLFQYAQQHHERDQSQRSFRRFNIFAVCAVLASIALYSLGWPILAGSFLLLSTLIGFKQYQSYVAGASAKPVIPPKPASAPSASAQNPKPTAGLDINLSEQPTLRFSSPNQSQENTNNPHLASVNCDPFKGVKKLLKHD